MIFRSTSSFPIRLDDNTTSLSIDTVYLNPALGTFDAQKWCKITASSTTVPVRWSLWMVLTSTWDRQIIANYGKCMRGQKRLQWTWCFLHTYWRHVETVSSHGKSIRVSIGCQNYADKVDFWATDLVLWEQWLLGSRSCIRNLMSSVSRKIDVEMDSFGVGESVRIVGELWCLLQKWRI